MKKKSSFISINTIIFFLFYCLISTSGITGLFYGLSLITIIIQAIFFPNPYLLTDLSSGVFFGFPGIVIVVLSYYTIRIIKNPRVFFLTTLLFTAVSHYLLTFSTNAQLNDFRLIIGALLYFLLLSFTLTLLWKRIILEKTSGEVLWLLTIMIFITIIHMQYSNFLLPIYTSFAWKLNSIDYLFSKLNMDFIYFCVVLLNILACITILGIISIKHLLKKMLYNK